ncbi:MAG: DUF1552 domain-containing protein [Polyangiaceae bacterium]|nr:DUF1552 domain-containing protein [Polyangiaceae bacterium]
MNRRIVLRGMAGAAVTAPFLGSVWERIARAQGASPTAAAAAGTQKQFIAMFTHYGCITNSFFPTTSQGTLAAADYTSTPSLAPLAPLAAKLLVPRGLRGMNEWTANNTAASSARGQGNDPHTQVVGSYFTLQPVMPNSNDPFSFDTSTKMQAKPIGSSLDHIMAQQLSSAGTPLFMRVGNSGGQSGESPQSNISWLLPAGSSVSASLGTTDGTTVANAYPGLGTPSSVYSALTGLFQSGTTMPMTQADYASVKGQSIIDLVRDDLTTLESFNMSQADHDKLEAWKALLTDTGAGAGAISAQCTQTAANNLGATSANVQKASQGGLGGDILTSMVASSLDGADMYSVVAVLAAMCNYNPVIVLKYPPNYTYSGLGLTEESHSLSHRLDNAGMSGSCYPDAVNLLLKLDNWYATKFYNLINMLNGIANPDGSSLLDSSATVWFNEMSDGNAHNLNNLPIIHAGSLNGYFKVGQAINVDPANYEKTGENQGQSYAQCLPDGGGNQMANGVNQGTGTTSTIADAPINKYFMNIMNAMGVKGDATTGFPSANGTGPVTSYGYSDNTASFFGGYQSGGGTIKSPGEFTEFKA